MYHYKKLQGPIIFLIIMLSMLLFSSCGRNSGAPESVLKKDLIASDNFSFYEMTLDSFKISKRQTLPQNQIDTVWVEVGASNDRAEAKMAYIMEYTLYNDGWIINNIRDDTDYQWSFKPRKGFNNDELVAALKGNFEESYEETYEETCGEIKIELISNDAEDISGIEDFNDSTLLAKYTITEVHENCDVVHEMQGNIGFGTTRSEQYPGGQWYIYSTEELSVKAENWKNLFGHWLYNESGFFGAVISYDLYITPGKEAGFYTFYLEYDSGDYVTGIAEDVEGDDDDNTLIYRDSDQEFSTIVWVDLLERSRDGNQSATTVWRINIPVDGNYIELKTDGDYIHLFKEKN